MHVTRIPALDGIRGLAIILVVIGHLKLSVMQTAPQVGVTLFFVLSGFLITGILVRQADSGSVNIVHFYRQRARRLVPALFVMLAVAALLARENWWDRTWPALLYVGNWPLMTQGAGALGNLDHVWSLAVEEHFYLIWPFVIGLVSAQRRLKIIALLTVGLGLWRLGLISSGADWNRVYYGSDTNAFAILAGCLVAVGRFKTLTATAGVVALAGLIGIGMLPLGRLSAGLLYPAVLIAAVAVHVASSVSLPLVEMDWLRWFGTVSYGLYLWHVPIFDKFDTHRIWVLPVALLFAWLSWKLIEQPVLNRHAARQEHLPASGSAGF